MIVSLCDDFIIIIRVVIVIRDLSENMSVPNERLIANTYWTASVRRPLRLGNQIVFFRPSEKTENISFRSNLDNSHRSKAFRSVSTFCVVLLEIAVSIQGFSLSSLLPLLLFLYRYRILFVYVFVLLTIRISYWSQTFIIRT